MAEHTSIEWCDHTFNPWQGCTKVASGCTNCYAEAIVTRFHQAAWGPHGTRVKTSAEYWRKPIKWNRDAEQDGVRRRVFCASLADVFEDWKGPIVDARGSRLVVSRTADFSRQDKYHGREADEPAERWATVTDLRQDLFSLIDETPWLDWLLLTKRIENARRMWPARDRHYDKHLDSLHNPHFRENVWIGCSIATQEDADRNVPELMKCRDLAPVMFLSIEPLLGPIDLDQCGATPCEAVGGAPDDITEPQPWPGVQWVIVGGESGPGARWCNLDWVRSIAEQCKAAEVPCFVKQLGSHPIGWRHDRLEQIGETERATGTDALVLWKLRDAKGGDPAEWPEDLRVREFPRTREEEPVPSRQSTGSSSLHRPEGGPTR
jgi:protein gp37